ncbi:hypothetical protein [Candidatus Thioglobus sp.]|jgi:Ca2+/Na+ antiporter|uniref:hypothetical protein n=1 Tax=Candidatus Thioglobus sp. TaxID=2026721 RepID=UPI001751EB0E|nr:hypothetical protein [Candidatus Thioglobus sp.]
MMNETLAITLKPSKYYLILSLLVYLLGLFTVWHYSYNFYLSALLSIALLVLAYRFFPKSIFLTKDESTNKITLNNERLTVEKNNKEIKQYSLFYPAYQSSLLVIITAGKKSIVVFKDSVEHNSLSQLNKFLNANT